MTTDWQNQRSEIYHDWLKNNYLRNVEAFILRLQQYHVDFIRINEFLTCDFNTWKQQRDKVYRLLISAEHELSPRSLFGTPPLSNCGDEVKAFLEQLVHELWLTRYPLKIWFSDALDDFRCADQIFNEIDSQLDSETRENIQRLKEKLDNFQEYYSALKKLVSAIGALPHKILMV